MSYNCSSVIYFSPYIIFTFLSYDFPLNEKIKGFSIELKKAFQLSLIRAWCMIHVQVHLVPHIIKKMAAHMSW